MWHWSSYILSCLSTWVIRGLCSGAHQNLQIHCYKILSPVFAPLIAKLVFKEYQIIKYFTLKQFTYLFPISSSWLWTCIHCWHLHWQQTIVNLTTFSSLVALMTIYSATSDSWNVRLMILFLVMSVFFLYLCFDKFFKYRIIEAWQQMICGQSWFSGISVGMGPANERCRYIVTTSLIGWAHT